MVADIGLRLQEGIQDLKLDQQLAPAREAVSKTLSAGSTSFFKAVEGMRGRWAQRSNSNISTASMPRESAEIGAKSSGVSTPPVEVTNTDFEDVPHTAKQSDYTRKTPNLRPFSLTSTNSLPSDSPVTSPNGAPESTPIKPLSAWGSGIGSFLSAKTARFSMARTPTTARPSDATESPTAFPPSPLPLREQYGDPEGSPLFNGMSPETSPTAIQPLASISAVLHAAESTKTITPSSQEAVESATAI